MCCYPLSPVPSAPPFFLFSFFCFLFFFSPFFFFLLVRVCVFASPARLFFFLFPFFLFVPSPLLVVAFFLSFLSVVAFRGGGSPGLRRLLLAGNPLLFFFGFFFSSFLGVRSWLSPATLHRHLPAGLPSAACLCFASFRSLACLCVFSIAFASFGSLACFFFFFLLLCFLLLLRLLPLAGLFCCFGRLLSLSFGLVAVVSGPFLGSMDLLPDVVLSAVSDSSGGSADQNCPAPLPPRLLLPVGKCRRLPSFTGTCYGDHVSWKGSSSTRIVSLQSGGAGRDRYLWGRHWGQSLTTLGADVGVIAETRIRGADHHALAIRGLWDAGFLALSHGCDADLPRGQDPAHYCLVQQMWAVGVVLAVRKDYIGSWSAVQRDSAGRGLAGNLTLQNGVVLRVIGVYGPSGASLPGFETNGARLAAESRLVSWVSSQLASCQEKGWLPLVAGDLQSVGLPSLDCWASSHVVRPSSLASCLATAGLVDEVSRASPRYARLYLLLPVWVC